MTGTAKTGAPYQRRDKRQGQTNRIRYKRSDDHTVTTTTTKTIEYQRNFSLFFPTRFFFSLSLSLSFFYVRTRNFTSTSENQSARSTSRELDPLEPQIHVKSRQGACNRGFLTSARPSTDRIYSSNYLDISPLASSKFSRFTDWILDRERVYERAYECAKMDEVHSAPFPPSPSR